MKRKGFIIITLLSCGLFFGSIATTSIIAKAEEENPIVEAINEGEAKEEEIKNFKDTFLTPLLSGVSITSILSAVVSITLAIINRRTNGKIKDSSDTIIALAKQTTESANLLIEAVKQRTIVEEENLKAIINLTKNCIEQVEKVAGSTEEVVKLRSALTQLAEIQKIIASHSAELVANGTAEELNKVVKTIRGE